MAEISSMGRQAQAIATSALRAQQARMRVSPRTSPTPTPPLRPPAAIPIAGRSRCSSLRVDGASGCGCPRSSPSRPFKTAYEPGNPSADAQAM